MLVKIYDAKELQKEFQKYDRDYFSIYGYEAIIDYFNECYETAQELDVIAICCDFNESKEREIRDNYLIDETIDIMDYLDYHTYAQKLKNGNILYITF